jgi:hypothetical protein
MARPMKTAPNRPPLHAHHGMRATTPAEADRPLSSAAPLCATRSRTTDDIHRVGGLLHFAAPRGKRARTAVPIIGVTAAALALGEPLGAREALALGLTLGGVALALRRA